MAATLGAGAALWAGHQTAHASTETPGLTPSPAASGATVDIRTFGAKGDRSADDLDAIRHAISAATQTDQYPAGVFIPAGNYRRRDSIALPNHLCLRGEGVSSILNSQNDVSFKKPILVNASRTGLISARLESLSLYGGSHAIRLDAEQENADLRLHNVAMLMQSIANLEANKLLQTVKISNCIFGSAPFGIRVLGTGTNCVIASASEWIDHSECAIQLRGTDGLTIIGGRFEGGGHPGKYCIDIENASNVLFVGCFFENVHEFLGRFRNVTGGVTFQSCHFSGTSLGNGDLRAFRWDQADTILVFRDCVSVQSMFVPGTIILEGVNSGIVAADVLQQGSSRSGKVVVQPRPKAIGGMHILVTIRRPAAGGDWDIRGALTLFSDPQSRLPTGIRRLTLSLRSNGTLSREDETTSEEGALPVRLIRASGDEWLLVADPGITAGRTLGWAFEWDCVGSAYPAIRAPLTS